MKKRYLVPLLLLALLPSKIFSMDTKEASEKYGDYFNDNWKHWMTENKRTFQPSIEYLSNYQNRAKNWDNNKYWIKRAVDTHDFYCSMLQVSSEKNNKYSANSKRLYKEQCLNKSYFNSQMKIKVATSKIDACNAFRKVDFFKIDKLISSSNKSVIFNDCAELYKTYSDNRKQFFSRLNPFYKMFYIHGLSLGDIKNEVENFHEKNKKCFISTNYNYKNILNKVSTPDSYNECMGWKWN